MPNSKDLSILENFKGIFCGRQGTRKSSTAATWPKSMYCFDLDDRMQSLRGYDVDYDTYLPPKGFEHLEQKLDQLIALSKTNNFPYKTILFSSITSSMRFFEIDALLQSEKLQSVDQRIKGMWMGKLHIPDMKHYQYRAVATYQVVYEYLKQLPCNLIVEAHIVNDYDEKGNVRGKKIHLPDKLTEEIPGWFDEVWEFFCEESIMKDNPPKYFIRFRGSLAKTTFRQLPDTICISHDKENKPIEVPFYDRLNKFLTSKEY